MEGYYWAILAATLLLMCGVGTVCYILFRLAHSLEGVKSMLRIIMTRMDDNERNTMARHSETVVTVERLTERLMQQVMEKDEELTAEEKELQRKQEQAFSDGVSNILNYGV